MLRPSIGADAGSRFRHVASLGAGSYGVVYEAIDARTAQRVAVKELQRVDAGSLSRFKHEFRALQDVHHPNLVGLKELIEEPDRWLIVMELVEGEDFLHFVRPGGVVFDEGRLRRALFGIASGLAALHGYGVLHRDLKPGNVRVTRGGRAVLLDFGLAIDIAEQQPAIEPLVGTVAYMAPEQAARTSIGPAADFYALGVCLYEALTGEWPFSRGSALDVLRQKQNEPAPRASTRVPRVPPDLDELCARLLERDPERRPQAAEVLRALDVSHDEPPPAPLTSSAPAAALFAGRDAELRQLERALARTHESALRIVLVEGESGVGKTELVAEFLRQTRAEHPELLVLQGRCYENEQVSYKAFDGCIDELSRALGSLPEAACAALLPLRAAVLGQLFPVLQRVGAIAHAPLSNLSADPTARRLEAFDALVAVLRTLAEERPLVLVTDDLQWADAESFRLLHAIVTHAAPPPILFVATLRPRGELAPDVLSQVEALRRLPETDVVQLLGLPPAPAEQLAARLLGPQVPSAWLQTIARESEGHPLFLGELVQFARSHDFATRGAITLEAALRARIEHLDERERALLEIVALAGRPHGAHTFARALSLPSVDEPARGLLAGKLLRLGGSSELGCYHDRIRHTAVSLIASGRLAQLHRRLALALAADPHADVAEQARHWDLAAQVDPALSAYRAAAKRALEGLAFVRAAELAARAMELLDDPLNVRFQELAVLRAHALSCAGRNAEAAVLYQQAADRADGETRIRLQSRVALQLLLSSDIERGFEMARALLREVGVRLPQGALGTLLFMFWQRLLLKIRGLDAKPRAPRASEDRRRFAYELVHQLATPLSVLHPSAFVLLITQQARRAVHLGIRPGIAEAYSVTGLFQCFEGRLRQADARFAKSRALCDALNDPVLSARQAYLEGSGRIGALDWSEGIACLERSQALLHAYSPDDPALLTNVRYHLGIGWYTIGAFDRLAERTEAWIAEARERGDRVAVALLTGMGHGFYRLLMRDEPECALVELDAAVAAMPPEPFSFAHLGHLFGTVMTLLYQGGPAALRWLDERAAHHKRPLLLRTLMGRRGLLVLEGLAELAAYATAEPNARPRLERRARRSLHKLLRDRAPFARAYAQLGLAQLSAITGDKRQALERARAAYETASRSELGVAQNASYLIGLLEGDPANPRCKQVLDALREQGFRDPSRALVISLPALPILAPSRVLPRRSGQSALIDRFELGHELGGGGFGTVVEARDLHTGRRVALKELVSKAGRSLERFKQEFRALQGVHHDHLVRLDALFEHLGTWYIAMELLEGVDLLAYFGAKGALTGPRVRSVFTGIARGIAALHGAGFVHRDVSPDNIRVTPEGRAVLLDFGLIGRIDDSGDDATTGSAAYAAPEQLTGATPHPSADVYALGCCLYRVLTGVVPFDGGTPAQVAQAKRAGPPRPPPAADPQLDALAELCMHMLASTPSERPSLAEVLSLLSTPLSRARHPSLTTEPEHAPRFTGRERELAQLDDAFERTCDDGLVMVFVEGESGVGKSALVAEFSERVARRSPGLIALRGRCYENEQVALKAFDGAVDQLARVLRTLPTPACEALLPRRAALLRQLFPVLSSVPAIAEASQKGLPAEPSARRRAAIEAFVKLLERLTEQHEVLFVIDDLQWADGESFTLLARLLEERATLPLLFVGTVRATRDLPDTVQRVLAPLRQHPGAENVLLEGLTEEACEALARTLFGATLSPERLRRLTDESKGHPLFLRELVELEKTGAAPASAHTLDDALRARIADLSAEARSVLSLVALADKPYGMHVFSRALHLGELPREAVVSLLGRGLVRRRGDDELTCYHDRIRRVVLAALSPDETRGLAKSLASALDSELRADPAERARLWDLAGDVERAIAAYERAGESALAALSFARAEQHYARALTLLSETRDECWHRILVQHAHALARIGQSAEAARAFALAAEHARGEARVLLRISAAQQLIQSAQVEAGLAASRALLAELGVAVPHSQGGALARLVWDRGLLALRGLDVRASRKVLPPATRTRLDAAWALALPLAWIDPLQSAALSSRHLRMALASGELSHVARALAEEAFNRAVQHPDDPRIDMLFERARAIEATSRDPALEAVIAFREGSSYAYRWQLAEASEHLERALQIVTERCPEEAFLRTNVRCGLGSVWANQFEHARLAAAVTTWTAEARDRSDQFALTMHGGLGFGMIAPLLRDQPDEARDELDRQHAQWPRDPFSFAHLGEMLGVTYIEGYRGGDRGLAWFDRELPRLSRAFLLKTALGRGTLLFFYAVAIGHAYNVASAAARPALRARLPKVVAELARLNSVFAKNMAVCTEVNLAVIDGERERALALAHDTVEKSMRIGHYLPVWPLRYAIGLIEGGDAGRERIAISVARFTEQGWRDPHRAVRCFCPTIELLAEKT